MDDEVVARDGFLYPDREDYGVDDERFQLILSSTIMAALATDRTLGVLVDTEVEHRTGLPMDMMDDLTLAGTRAQIVSEGLVGVMECIYTLENNGFEIPDDFI